MDRSGSNGQLTFKPVHASAGGWPSVRAPGGAKGPGSAEGAGGRGRQGGFGVRCGGSLGVEERVGRSLSGRGWRGTMFDSRDGLLDECTSFKVFSQGTSSGCLPKHKSWLWGWFPFKCWPWSWGCFPPKEYLKASFFVPSRGRGGVKGAEGCHGTAEGGH